MSGAPPKWAWSWGEDFRCVSRGRGLDCPPLGRGLDCPPLGLPLAQKPSWPTLGGARILFLLGEFRGHPVATLC